MHYLSSSVKNLFLPISFRASATISVLSQCVQFKQSHVRLFLFIRARPDKIVFSEVHLDGTCPCVVADNRVQLSGNDLS